MLEDTFEYGDIELLFKNTAISGLSGLQDFQKKDLVNLIGINLISPMNFFNMNSYSDSHHLKPLMRLKQQLLMLAQPLAP